jgi:hypothetical protein
MMVVTIVVENILLKKKKKKKKNNNMRLKVFINISKLVCHVIMKQSSTHQYGTQSFSRKTSFISVFQLPDCNTRLQVQRLDASMGTVRQHC